VEVDPSQSTRPQGETPDGFRAQSEAETGDGPVRDTRSNGREGAAFKQAIWREGSRNQVGKLTESDYAWADYATADWRRVRHIYAIDADGNRWHAPRSQLRSVRDENDPKGTIEEFGIRPVPTE
jgi:hypothetical protein